MGGARPCKAGRGRDLRPSICPRCEQSQRRPGRWRPPGGFAVTCLCYVTSWASAAVEAWAWLRVLLRGLSAAERTGGGFMALSCCRVSGCRSLFSRAMGLDRGALVWGPAFLSVGAETPGSLSAFSRNGSSDLACDLRQRTVFRLGRT